MPPDELSDQQLTAMFGAGNEPLRDHLQARPQRRGLPPTTRPAGVLLAAERGADAAENRGDALRRRRGAWGPADGPRNRAAQRCFSHEAVAEAAAKARSRNAELQHTPAAVRRAAVATLRGWMDAAAASAGANSGWTGPRAQGACGGGREGDHRCERACFHHRMGEVRGGGGAHAGLRHVLAFSAEVRPRACGAQRQNDVRRHMRAGRSSRSRGVADLLAVIVS